MIVDHTVAQAYLDARLQIDHAVAIGPIGLRHVGEDHAFTQAADALTSHPVQPQHHVLGRHHNGLPGGGREDVVGRHHQGAGFELRFQRQRDVHSHLVAVEVGVECRAHQRVQLDRLTLDQDGLKRLNAQTMQSRCTVEQHGMFADHLLQHVPDLRLLPFHHALGGLDGGRNPQALQAREHEWLEQFQGHALGQTALMQAEGGPHHDHRAAGIVDALAEQVLPEPALLALDHVGERLERTLVGTRDGPTAPAVVQQGVHRLLQHALFIAHDDVGGGQFQQALEAVVAIDDAPIQIVQVGGGKTSAIQRHQGAQLRRQHRQNFQNHPFGPVARLDERFHQLQTLGQAFDLGFRVGAGHFLAQTHGVFG